MNNSITNICYNIIEFQARAACVLHAGRLESAIRDAFKVDEWDKLLSAIEKGEANVKDHAERKNMNYVLKIFAKVDNHEDKQKQKPQVSHGHMRLVHRP